MTLLISAIFLLCFFIESIFGFGGLVLTYAILSFFVDIKDLIFAGMYIGICASSFVLLSDWSSFSKKMFLRLLPLALVGTIIGVLLFGMFSTEMLLVIFAIFLIIFALRSLLFTKITALPKTLRNFFVVAGGVMQGIYGTGGPFTLLGVRDEFKNKSELRSTMAMFFITFNLVRIVQLNLQGKFNGEAFFSLWWIALPLGLVIFAGYKIHLNLNEKFSQQMISIILLIAGVALLVR
jgi:uncharacterized membrane protein YfcA